MTQKKLIVVAGPTAVGKTAFCIRLARELQAEIFSCDSRQFYRELSVGTAKPSALELQQVKHHFIDTLSIQDTYTVAEYEKEAKHVLEHYFKHKPIAILTGGSGLFMKAVTHGLDEIPDVPGEVREQIMLQKQTSGFESLVEELKKRDPEYIKTADLSNTQRVIRALEVSVFTGKPFSSWHGLEKKNPDFRQIRIGLDMPREILYERINHRVDQMLAAGLIDEVKSVAAFREKNALKTVGYKEVFDHLKGLSTADEMTELIKRNTRRYAKRQLTWFRNQDDFQWFHPSDFEDALLYIRKQID